LLQVNENKYDKRSFLDTSAESCSALFPKLNMFAKGFQELRIKKRILEEAIAKATHSTKISAKCKSQSSTIWFLVGIY
jgi:hypothetical protein